MLPIWVWLIIFVVVFSVNLYINKYIRIFMVPTTHSYNDFISASQHLLCIIYGVLLAFIVVFSWQSYTTLKDNLQKEAIALMDVWRDAEAFGPKDQQLFTQAVIYYLKSIHESEWPVMKKGETPVINNAYSHLWKTAGNFNPKTDSQKIFYANLIQELSDVNSYRRARLLAISTPTPSVLWVFLIGGAFYIVLLTSLYHVSYKLNLFVVILQGTIMVFAFYLISNFNHPFEGALAITDSDYTSILEQIIEIDKVRHPNQ